MLFSPYYWMYVLKLVLAPFVPFLLVAFGYLRLVGHRWVSAVLGVLFGLIALWHLYLLIGFLPAYLSDRAFSSVRAADVAIATVVLAIGAAFAFINYKAFRAKPSSSSRSSGAIQ